MMSAVAILLALLALGLVIVNSQRPPKLAVAPAKRQLPRPRG